MEPRSECGSGGCVTCPFSSNDQAAEVQKYGCLPEPVDIVRMKRESGHNWACHGDESVMCGGFARYVTRRHPDLDLKQGGLISYTTWYREGEAAALREASRTSTRNASRPRKPPVPDKPSSTPPLVAYAFYCHDCRTTFLMEVPYDDVTTSGGGCPTCGGSRWNVYAKDATGRVTAIA